MAANLHNTAHNATDNTNSNATECVDASPSHVDCSQAIGPIYKPTTDSLQNGGSGGVSKSPHASFDSLLSASQANDTQVADFAKQTVIARAIRQPATIVAAALPLEQLWTTEEAESILASYQCEAAPKAKRIVQGLLQFIRMRAACEAPNPYIVAALGFQQQRVTHKIYVWLYGKDRAAELEATQLPEQQ
jgi:hypothetical protein